MWTHCLNLRKRMKKEILNTEFLLLIYTKKVASTKPRVLTINLITKFLNAIISSNSIGKYTGRCRILWGKVSIKNWVEVNFFKQLYPSTLKSCICFLSSLAVQLELANVSLSRFNYFLWVFYWKIIATLWVFMNFRITVIKLWHKGIKWKKLTKNCLQKLLKLFHSSMNFKGTFGWKWALSELKEGNEETQQATTDSRITNIKYFESKGTGLWSFFKET